MKYFEKVRIRLFLCQIQGFIIHCILLITIVCGGLFTPFVVQAADMVETCADGAGTVVKGNNGTVYCKSNRTMNWWTALGWCRAINMVPFSFPNDCRCVGEKCKVTADCSNLAGVGIGGIWTATPNGTKYAYRVDGNGTVYVNAVFFTRDATLNALCKSDI